MTSGHHAFSIKSNKNKALHPQKTKRDDTRQKNSTLEIFNFTTFKYLVMTR